MPFLSSFWPFVSKVAIAFTLIVLLSLGLCAVSSSNANLADIGFYGILLGGAGLVVTAAVALLVVILNFFMGGGSPPPPSLR